MGRRRRIDGLSEKAIQAAVVDHWKKLGLPDTLVAAIPNAYAHGQPGLTPGLPDLVVMGPRVPVGVGFIELKRDQRSPVSPAQREFQALCGKLGAQYWLVRGRDAAIAVLENWGVVRPSVSATRAA